MGTVLPNNSNANWATKILWKNHQKDEYKHVDNYKEGLCYVCFSRKAVASTLMEVCSVCQSKKGREAILVQVGGQKMYGMCFICGAYKFKTYSLNVRICQSCNYHVRQNLKSYNKKGGLFYADPFWKHIRKKYGNDWQELWSTPEKKQY